MSAMLWLTILSAGFVLGACLYLALHDDYRTGVLGNLGMLAVGVASVASIGRAVFSEAPEAPLAAIIWIGLALTYGQTLLNFQRRLRYKGKPGWYAKEAA